MTIPTISPLLKPLSELFSKILLLLSLFFLSLLEGHLDGSRYKQVVSRNKEVESVLERVHLTVVPSGFTVAELLVET